MTEFERKFKVCTHCGSKDITYVRFVMSNGRVQLRRQCRSCGLMPSLNYKHKDVPDMSKIPFWSPEKRESFYNKIKDRHEKSIQDGYYNEVYLRSDEWRNKRKNILVRDNHSCSICNRNYNLHVHHITYDRVYNEALEQLITLCRDCHSKVHSEEEIIKDGIVYNFGKLKACLVCKKLHNDPTSRGNSLCNPCVEKARS